MDRGPDDAVCRGAEPIEVAADRRRLRRLAMSVVAAVAPFGVAFGAVCSEAGMSVAQAMGFSTLVFTGGSQFAAVTVLADGGAAVAAVTAGLLLSLRSLAYGVVMAPVLEGPRWWRALASQLMIDEAAAIGTVSEDPALRRYGYFAAGLGVFVVWNLTTFIGAVAFGDAVDLIERFGVDATIPAAFLGLIWPRLADGEQRRIAGLGAVIAFLLVPFVPAGVPIVAAAAAVSIVRPWEPRSARSIESAGEGS